MAATTPLTPLSAIIIITAFVTADIIMADDDEIISVCDRGGGGWEES